MAVIGPIQPAVDADDADWYYSDEEWGLEVSYNSRNFWGKYGGYQVPCYLRFQLPSAIPAGATIDTGAGQTKLEFYTEGTHLSIEASWLYAIESSDCPQKTTGAQRPAYLGGSTNTYPNTQEGAGAIEWNHGPMSPSTWYSVNIGPLIQHLVDTYGGLASGAYIGLIIDGDSGEGSEDYNNFQSAINANATKLTITYTAGGQTYTKTLSLDSYLKKIYSRTASLDGYLKKVYSQNASIDAYLYQVILKSLGIDGVLQKLGLTKDASLDALLTKLSLTKDVSLDGFLSKIVIKTLGLDGLLKKLSMKDLSIDAFLKQSGAQSVSLDGLLRAAGLTRQTALDALLKQIGIQSLSLDGLLRAAGLTRQTALDAILIAVGETSRNISIDALLRKLQSSTIATDAFLFKALALTLNLDALIIKPQSASLSLDALAFKSFSSSVSADAVLSALLSHSVNLDALIRGMQSESISLDGILYVYTPGVRYRLKSTAPMFQYMKDGQFRNQIYIRGIEYSQIPADEADKFEEV